MAGYRNMKFIKYILLFAILVIASYALIYYSFLFRTNVAVYVPIDERPVNLNYVIDTMDAVKLDLLTPPAKHLPQKTQPADSDKIWQWLDDNCKKANYLVLSSDTLVYGGLTQSRLHDLDTSYLEQSLKRIEGIKERYPRKKIYIFSTIMRTPRYGGTQEPAYYSKYGNEIFTLTALIDKEELGYITNDEKKLISEIKQSIPEEVMSDWYARREKNMNVNKKLIDYARNGVIDYLVICRDDSAPFSQSHMEYRELAEYAGELGRDKFVSFPGADETGLILLTRAYNDYYHTTPQVFIRYTKGEGEKTVPGYEDQEIGKSVTEHILAAGGSLAERIEDADLVLAINTPIDGITEEASSPKNKISEKEYLNAFAAQLEEDIKDGNRVALADISFSNGADNTLMEELKKKGLLPELTGYGAWNTASNSLGYALCQGILASEMAKEDQEDILITRYLDDWAYQSNIREEVVEDVLQPRGIEKDELGEDTDLVSAEIKERLLRFCDNELKEFQINDIKIEIPWQRLFEIDVKEIQRGL